MRKRLLAGALAALLVPAAEAVAGDPIMPLSDVRAGMQCTGYSVVRGTEPAAFDVEILDVVGRGPSAQLLVRVSGDAVDRTGIGAGFSGSPVYCPGDDGVARNAGAISATIGDWGGKTVLATPIESILHASPQPAPGGAADAGAADGGPRRVSRAGHAPARWTMPLTVQGLSTPMYRALARRASRAGLVVLPAPAAPRQVGAAPGAPSAEAAGLRPGSAVSIGLSSGDVSVGAIGTVAYTDGPNVWTLGHAYEALGPRNLFLQNAYVSTVINNPIQFVEEASTYKLATPLATVGTVTDDTFAAVAGRVGGLPAATPVRIYNHDLGDGRESASISEVADETAVGTPGGMSGLSFVAPLALAQSTTEMYPSIPTRMKAMVCFQIVLRERPEPVRLCNRYVDDGTSFSSMFGNVAAVGAAADLSEMLSMIDSYRPADLHVDEVSARVRIARGQYQAFIRSVKLPRRARPGERIRVRMHIQRVRGERETITFPMRAPKRRGLRQVVFRGRDADLSDELMFGGFILEFGDEDEERDSTGPKTVGQLVKQIRQLKTYDGIRTNRGRRVYRHSDLRIGGYAKTSIEIRGRR